MLGQGKHESEEERIARIKRQNDEIRRREQKILEDKKFAEAQGAGFKGTFSNEKWPRDIAPAYQMPPRFDKPMHGRLGQKIPRVANGERDGPPPDPRSFLADEERDYDEAPHSQNQYNNIEKQGNDFLGRRNERSRGRYNGGANRRGNMGGRERKNIERAENEKQWKRDWDQETEEVEPSHVEPVISVSVVQEPPRRRGGLGGARGGCTIRRTVVNDRVRVQEPSQPKTSDLDEILQRITEVSVEEPTTDNSQEEKPLVIPYPPPPAPVTLCTSSVEYNPSASTPQQNQSTAYAQDEHSYQHYTDQTVYPTINEYLHDQQANVGIYAEQQAHGTAHDQAPPTVVNQHARNQLCDSNTFADQQRQNHMNRSSDTLRNQHPPKQISDQFMNYSQNQMENIGSYSNPQMQNQVGHSHGYTSQPVHIQETNINVVKNHPVDSSSYMKHRHPQASSNSYSSHPPAASMYANQQAGNHVGGVVNQQSVAVNANAYPNQQARHQTSDSSSYVQSQKTQGEYVNHSQNNVSDSAHFSSHYNLSHPNMEQYQQTAGSYSNAQVVSELSRGQQGVSDTYFVQPPLDKRRAITSVPVEPSTLYSEHASHPARPSDYMPPALPDLSMPPPAIVVPPKTLASQILRSKTDMEQFNVAQEALMKEVPMQNFVTPTSATYATPTYAVSQCQEPYVTSQTQSPYVTSQTPSPYVTSQTQSLYVTSQTQAPYVTSETHSQYVTPQTQSPYATSQTKAPYVTSQIQSPYLSSQTQSPYVSSQTQSPYVSSQTQSPYVSSQTQSPYVSSQTQSPYVTSQTQSPYVTSQTQSPFVTSQTQSPYVTSQTQSPYVTPQTACVIPQAPYSENSVAYQENSNLAYVQTAPYGNPYEAQQDVGYYMMSEGDYTTQPGQQYEYKEKSVLTNPPQYEHYEKPQSLYEVDSQPRVQSEVNVHYKTDSSPANVQYENEKNSAVLSSHLYCNPSPEYQRESSPHQTQIFYASEAPRSSQVPQPPVSQSTSNNMSVQNRLVRIKQEKMNSEQSRVYSQPVPQPPPPSAKTDAPSLHVVNKSSTKGKNFNFLKQAIQQNQESLKEYLAADTQDETSQAVTLVQHPQVLVTSEKVESTELHNEARPKHDANKTSGGRLQRPTNFKPRSYEANKITPNNNGNKFKMNFDDYDSGDFDKVGARPFLSARSRQPMNNIANRSHGDAPKAFKTIESNLKRGENRNMESYLQEKLSKARQDRGSVKFDAKKSLSSKDKKPEEDSVKSEPGKVEMFDWSAECENSTELIEREAKARGMRSPEGEAISCKVPDRDSTRESSSHIETKESSEDGGGKIEESQSAPCDGTKEDDEDEEWEDLSDEEEKKKTKRKSGGRLYGGYYGRY